MNEHIQPSLDKISKEDRTAILRMDKNRLQEELAESVFLLYGLMDLPDLPGDHDFTASCRCVFCQSSRFLTRVRK